jgi:hypothetical protein
LAGNARTIITATTTKKLEIFFMTVPSCVLLSVLRVECCFRPDRAGDIVPLVSGTKGFGRIHLVNEYPFGPRHVQTVAGSPGRRARV